MPQRERVVVGIVIVEIAQRAVKVLRREWAFEFVD
jgi:hypothetical protein